MTNILALTAIGLVAVILVALALGWWFDHYMDEDHDA